MQNRAQAGYSNAVCDLQAALDRTFLLPFLHCLVEDSARSLAVALGIRSS
jgi:hypothetical protein